MKSPNLRAAIAVTRQDLMRQEQILHERLALALGEDSE